MSWAVIGVCLKPRMGRGVFSFWGWQKHSIPLPSSVLFLHPKKKVKSGGNDGDLASWFATTTTKIMIIIIKQTKEETLLSGFKWNFTPGDSREASSMHPSERDSILTSPFLRAHAETRKMLCYFSKQFTRPFSDNAQEACIIEEEWSLPIPGIAALPDMSYPGSGAIPRQGSSLKCCFTIFRWEALPVTWASVNSHWVS